MQQAAAHTHHPGLRHGCRSLWLLTLHHYSEHMLAQCIVLIVGISVGCTAFVNYSRSSVTAHNAGSILTVSDHGSHCQFTFVHSVPHHVFIDEQYN